MFDMYDGEIVTIEGYCDYCEREGHTFHSCPARDDEYPEEGE